MFGNQGAIDRSERSYEVVQEVMQLKGM